MVGGVFSAMLCRNCGSRGEFGGVAFLRDFRLAAAVGTNTLYSNMYSDMHTGYAQVVDTLYMYTEDRYWYQQ